MYYGKKKWIIIAIVVIVLIIAITGVGLFLFFKTDLFKSNSELFYKYMGEQLVAYKSSDDTQMSQVKALKEIKPYTTEGELTVGYENSELEQNPISNALENLVIKVNGKYDKSNEIENTSVKLINGTQELFAIDSAKTEDVYALRSNEIVKDAYVGIRNENLRVLAQKLGFGSVSAFMPDSMESTNIQEDLLQIPEEDMKHIQEIYAPVLSQMIKDSNFSKQNGVTISNDSQSYTCNSYRLDLSGTELKYLIMAILTQLQTDSITLNIISTNASALGLPDEYTSIDSITAIIQQTIDNLQEVELPEEGLSIVVYESEGKAVAIEVIVKNLFKVTMFSDVKSNSIALNMKIENLSSSEDFNVITVALTMSETATQTLADLDFNKDNLYMFKVTFESNGSATTDNVQNNLSISIDAEENSIVANYSENIEFTDEISDIIKLDNTNTAILNDYTTEQLSIFIPQIQERIAQVFAEKLVNLGIATQSNENNEIDNEPQTNQVPAEQ